MTTYTEFNRDLFLCNTLQRDTDGSFPSLIFANNRGNNVLTYNNLQEDAMFFFIPRKKDYNTPLIWYSLVNQTNYLYDVSDCINYWKKNNYIFKDKTNTHSDDTYDISYTLYNDLQINRKSYNSYLQNLSKYSIDNYIHAYTLGTLQSINAKNATNGGIMAKITNIEGFVEGATQSSSDVKYTFMKLSGGRGELIPDPPTPAEEVRINNVANGAVKNAKKQVSTHAVNAEENVKKIKIYPIKNSQDLMSKVPAILGNKTEGFIEGNTGTDFLINRDAAVKSGIQAGTATMYYEYSSTDIYQLTDKLYDVIDISCAKYPINATCSTDKMDIERAKCEVCKNFAYRDWYDANNSKNIRHFANHDDSKQEYSRSWIQTCNLGIGILLLSIGIYYQQSK